MTAETTEPQYPEHEKMATVKEASQAIGDFLDWCQETGIYLYSHQRVESYDGQLTTKTLPHNEGFERLLARHFEIDLAKINAEKDEMLAEIRRMNGIDP